MKRLVVFGTVCLFALSVSAEALAQGPRPSEGRPGGGDQGKPGKPGGEHAKPPGGGHGPGPGRPSHGGPPHQGPGPARPPRPQPQRPGRPPSGGHGHYQLGGYRPPPGYYHRQWGVGLILPRFFYTQTYWIGGPGAYGLPPAPRGTHWVRVDNDALLVSWRSGRIIQIVRDIFY